MRHFAASSFWHAYDTLPKHIQILADQRFEMLKENPHRPSLHLKKIKQYWSARVSIGYRALAVEVSSGLLWFWIGSHAEYEKIIKQ